MDAIHAVDKQASIPPISARTTKFEICFARDGANELSVPIIIPTALKFENPHSA